MLRRLRVPAPGISAGPPLRLAIPSRLHRRDPRLDRGADPLLHLPLLPLRHRAGRGRLGAHQGAAPRHEVVHETDPVLATGLE